MIPMRKAAIIGDGNTFEPFRALGLDVFSVSSSKEACEALDRVLEGTYAVLFVSETAAGMLGTALDPVRSGSFPIVNIIPGPADDLEAGTARLKRIVEKAIGVDILFKGEES